MEWPHAGVASHVDEAGQCAEKPVFTVHGVPDRVQVAIFIPTGRFRRWWWVAVHDGRGWSCRGRGSVGFHFLCTVDPSIWKQRDVQDFKSCTWCFQIDSYLIGNKTNRGCFGQIVYTPYLALNDTHAHRLTSSFDPYSVKSDFKVFSCLAWTLKFPSTILYVWTSCYQNWETHFFSLSL